MRAFGNRSLVTALAMSVLAFLYAPILVMMVFSFNDSQYTGLPFKDSRSVGTENSSGTNKC